MFIDLERKEILNKNKISDQSIKELRLSNDETVMFTITSNEILAFDANTLKVLYQRNLDFNPWDVVIIPNKDIVIISGSKNKIEVLDTDNFRLIESLQCGQENKDVSSLLYDTFNSLLISGTESGTLDMWKVSENGLEKDKEFKIGDNIYWLQNTDEYIAFSTSRKDIILYWITEQKLLTLPNTLGEARFALSIINNESYLLYQQKERNLSLSNLTTRELDSFQLKELPGRVNFIDLTSNGDIIAVTSEGVIVANFIKKDNSNATKYDFNSKSKNIAVEKFIFNELNDSIALQCKDETLKVISLDDANISNIAFSFKDSYGVEIKDFYKENILLADYKDVYIVNIQTNEIKEIFNKDDDFSSIKNIKITNNNSFAIIYNSDHSDYLTIYNFEANKVNSKKLGHLFGAIFISNNKLVTTSMNNPSKIIDIETKEVIQFDTRHVFDKNDDTMIFDNENYCIRISIASHSYEMDCWDLTLFDANNHTRKIWQVEDPSLESFIPLGYCKLNEYFYIIDKLSGEMLAINKLDGSIMKFYKLQNSIEDIQMSNSGQYIAWRLKTGEFSYISYPFQSCEVSDE